MPLVDRHGHGRPGEKYGWGRDGRVRLEERPIFPNRQRDSLDGLVGGLGRLRLGDGGGGSLLGGSMSGNPRRLLRNGPGSGSVRGSLQDLRRDLYEDMDINRGSVRGSLWDLRHDLDENDLDMDRGSLRGSLRRGPHSDLDMNRGPVRGSLQDFRRNSFYEHDLEMNRGYSSNEQLGVGRSPGLPALPRGLRSRSRSSLGSSSVHNLPHLDRQPRNYHYQRPYVEDDIESLEDRRREEELMRSGRDPGNLYEESMHEEDWIGPISMRGGL